MNAENFEFMKLTIANAKARSDAWAKWLADYAANVPATCCATHKTPLELDELRTQATYCPDVQGTLMFRPMFRDCTACSAAREVDNVSAALEEAGVQKIMIGCRFANWTPNCPAEVGYPDRTLEFTQKKIGFLFMIGDIGTGKTHLAVAAMTEFRRPVFVKQATLLMWLRKTYRDRQAVDPVEICQTTSLLVLDEIGLSVGGKDELPLLHEILDYRHGEQLPTIITGNLKQDELAGVLGERMIDRIRQSIFAVLNFTGPSRRRGLRDSYIGA